MKTKSEVIRKAIREEQKEILEDIRNGTFQGDTFRKPVPTGAVNPFAFPGMNVRADDLGVRTSNRADPARPLAKTI